MEPSMLPSFHLVRWPRLIPIFCNILQILNLIARQIIGELLQVLLECPQIAWRFRIETRILLRHDVLDVLSVCTRRYIIPVFFLDVLYSPNFSPLPSKILEP